MISASQDQTFIKQYTCNHLGNGVTIFAEQHIVECVAGYGQHADQAHPYGEQLHLKRHTNFLETKLTVDKF